MLLFIMGDVVVHSERCGCLYWEMWLFIERDVVVYSERWLFIVRDFVVYIGRCGCS